MNWLEGFLCLIFILFSIGIAAGLAQYSRNGYWVHYLFWSAVVVIMVFGAIFIILL